MSQENEPRTKRLRRGLAALLGACLGVLVFALWLTRPGHSPEQRLRQVITVLPADLRQRGEALLGGAAGDGEPALQTTGIIQAEQVAIASELGGRIAAIPVAEGDRVQQGDLLVQLDTALIDAQIEAAETLLAVAQAGLAQAQAGARPGQIEVAKAQLALAEAGRIAAQQAISDTLALVENPQDIQLQIAVAQAQAQAASYQVAQATARKDAIEIAKNAFEDIQSQVGSDGRLRTLVASGSVDDLPIELPPEIIDLLPGLADGDYTYGDWELHIHDGRYELYRSASIPYEFHLTPNQWWQAWVGVNAATAQQQGISSSLYHLYQQRDHPQLLEAQVDQAVSALAQAEAQVAAAQALVDRLTAGAGPEQITALEARVAQAEAVVAALWRQREMLALTAPREGTVVSLAARPGEVAAQGATLLALANLERLKLVVYVPENRLGQVHLGQPVQITVDSFSGRSFVGQVEQIANRAEFTPRNVATQEERVNLVFAVEVRVTNEGAALKPGMPADVVFELSSGGEQ